MNIQCLILALMAWKHKYLKLHMMMLRHFYVTSIPWNTVNITHQGPSTWTFKILMSLLVLLACYALYSGYTEHHPVAGRTLHHSMSWILSWGPVFWLYIRFMSKHTLQYRSTWCWYSYHSVDCLHLPSDTPKKFHAQKTDQLKSDRAWVFTPDGVLL